MPLELHFSLCWLCKADNCLELCKGAALVLNEPHMCPKNYATVPNGAATVQSGAAVFDGVATVFIGAANNYNGAGKVFNGAATAFNGAPAPSRVDAISLKTGMKEYSKLPEIKT